jgi:hypothetical protein
MKMEVASLNGNHNISLVEAYFTILAVIELVEWQSDGPVTLYIKSFFKDSVVNFVQTKTPLLKQQEFVDLVTAMLRAQANDYKSQCFLQQIQHISITDRRSIEQNLTSFLAIHCQDINRVGNLYLIVSSLWLIFFQASKIQPNIAVKLKLLDETLQKVKENIQREIQHLGPIPMVVLPEYSKFSIQ